MAGIRSLSHAQAIQVEAQLAPLASFQRSYAESLTVAAPGGTLEVAAPTQDEAEELEALRADLRAVFDTYESWSGLVPDDAQYLGFVADGQATIAAMTYEDLAAVRAQLEDIPEWQATLAPDIEAILEGAPPGSALMRDFPVLSESAANHIAGLTGSIQYDRRPPIDAGDQCSDYTLNLTYDQVVARIIAEAVLRYVSLGLKFAAEVAPKDIKITIFGTGVSIPNPYTLLILIGKLIVNRVADGLAADLAVNSYCAAIIHWKFLKIHAQSLIDRSQDILFQELEYHNRMTARYNALDLTERELWKMQMQLAMEENLLLDAPAADGHDENRMAIFQFVDTACFNPEELLSTPVPPFDTPEPPVPEDPLELPDRYVPLPTLAPFVGPPDPREDCGLELVRRIVAESILHNQQAGNNVHNALALLAAGDTFLANHLYAQAYNRYRQAYQAAVKPDPEP
jgi:hypothetical protein